MRPWSNVLANPDVGCVLTESGGGYSWAGNSRLHQITAWSNDPVSDHNGEWWLLQDSRSGALWSLTPNAWGDARSEYQVTHAPGSTRISHIRGGLSVAVTFCVGQESAIKSVRIALHNTGERTKRLRLLGLVEWIMGAQRSGRNTCLTSMQHISGMQGRSTNLLCTQLAQDGGFGGSTAFLSLGQALSDVDGNVDWTCDRREFFNTLGQLVVPRHLGERIGEGLDPCAAIAIAFQMDVGAHAEYVFSIGHAPTLIAASAMLVGDPGQNALNREAEVASYWNTLLGNCTVQTPDPLLNVLVNRWFLYQAISCSPGENPAVPHDCRALRDVAGVGKRGSV